MFLIQLFVTMISSSHYLGHRPVSQFYKPYADSYYEPYYYDYNGYYPDYNYINHPPGGYYEKNNYFKYPTGKYYSHYSEVPGYPYSFAYTFETPNNEYAYESSTGQNNMGLDVALRNGTAGLSGLAGAAGLEGGLAHGRDSNTFATNQIEDSAINSLNQIVHSGGPAENSKYRQEMINMLGADRANSRVGGLIGAASLNGNGGMTGAAGMGKIIGNEPGYGENLGAMEAVAASEGLNGGLTMAPEDLGMESKESLGGTSKVASAGQVGESLGIKAGLEAGIDDQKALQTLAGLGEGMAVADALEDQAEAIKSQGIEGAATRVSGYAGIPGSGGSGSYASLLGMGPSGSASKVSAIGRGLKHGASVSESAAYNDIRLLKKLNEDVRKKKEDVVEDNLKINMVKADLEEEIKQ